jgi:hypothetical protein
MFRLRKFLALPLLLAALGARAQTLPSEIEVGYRWTSIDGNNLLYRSQINEQSGLLLRVFSLSGADEKGLIEQYRIDANDLGAGPSGLFRMQAEKSGAYKFNLRYRQADAFSALPSFANPLLGQGVTISQHTFDRTRRLVDADLQMLPNSKFSPFVGYSWNRFNGPGQTTYHAGQDEFVLLQNLRDTEQEFRVGTGFTFGNAYGELLQGWRRFRGNETLTLAPGGNNGNSPTPILGLPQSASAISRTDQTKVTTPFTNFTITDQFGPRVRLNANYVRFATDSKGSENEDLTGALASFNIDRFFFSSTEGATSRAKNTTWRGGARAEINLRDGLDFFGSYQRDHRELDGAGVIDTIFLQTVTFTNIDPRQLETILNAQTSFKRDEDVVNAAISARALGPFTIRAGVAETNQDVTISPDLAEIVVPGNQGGAFSRRIRTYDVATTFSKAGFSAVASFRKDDANRPIVRSDYLNRDRYRLRASWRAPKYFRFGAAAEQTKQNNDAPDIGYDAKIRQYSGDVQFTPIEKLTLRATGAQYRANSTFLFRQPQDFAIGDSIHVEKGTSIDGGVTFLFPRMTFDGDLGRFKNTGTLPFTMNRARLRTTFVVKANTGLAAEWTRDKYSETNLLVGNYNANRYGLFLRYAP